MTDLGFKHYDVRNVTNQNQSLVRNELGHYFISLMICYTHVLWLHNSPEDEGMQFLAEVTSRLVSKLDRVLGTFLILDDHA